MTTHSEPSPAPAPHGLKVGLIDLIASLSSAMDLINPVVVDHHKRVAYIAARIAAQAGLPAETQTELLMAGLLHDVGAFSLPVDVRLATLDFETDHVSHAEDGYRLLNKFPKGFRHIARIVRHHHLHYKDHRHQDEPEVLLASNLLFLADRVDAVLRAFGGDPRLAVDTVLMAVRAKAGNMFDPDLVRAFESLADFSGFWIDLGSPRLFDVIRGMGASRTRLLDIDGVQEFSAIFSQVIDFRSRFTATHSRGVASCGVAMARLAGFDETQCKMMRVAGDLHDLGKLAVPRGILEKPGPLSAEESQRMREHARFGDDILGGVPGLEVINAWASSHHERLDGQGYPFGRTADDLATGARILAVADVFTALAEDRPYRPGMSPAQAMAVLDGMAEDGALDADLVGMVYERYSEMDAVRVAAQEAARADFQSFYA